MARAILALNALVLLTNFYLTFVIADVQGKSMLASASYGSAGFTRRGSGVPDTSLAFLRVAQSLERVLPKERLDTLTPEQMRAIYDATTRYTSFVSGSVMMVLADGTSGSQMRAAYDLIGAIGKDARREIELALGSAFRDQDVVSRLTGEILNSAR